MAAAEIDISVLLSVVGTAMAVLSYQWGRRVYSDKAVEDARRRDEDRAARQHKSDLETARHRAIVLERLSAVADDMSSVKADIREVKEQQSRADARITALEVRQRKDRAEFLELLVEQQEMSER